MLFDRFAMRIFMYSRTVEDARPYKRTVISTVNKNLPAHTHSKENFYEKIYCNLTDRRGGTVACVL